VPSLHSPLCRALARVLIAALLFALVPIPTEASIPRALLPDPRPPVDLELGTAEETAWVVVIVVADPSGLTKTAFGELYARTGTDPIPDAFAGEPLDPNSGFQYHRARWMDPRTGRFHGMDPFVGRTTDPRTLHRYLYAAADPTNMTDPTGEDFVTTVTIVAIVATLAVATFTHFMPRSQNPFGSGLHVLAFDWRNRFTLGKGELTSEEIEIVKLWTYQTARLAFSGFAVTVSEGGGTNRMIVKQSESVGGYAGSTLLGQAASEIGYDVLESRARYYAPNKSDRREIAAGIGRGIGATAAHELAHQVGVPWMDQTRDPNGYDFHSSDRFSQYYGQLHWIPANIPELQKRLGY
jgi:RHS repeat-associated protein